MDSTQRNPEPGATEEAEAEQPLDPQSAAALLDQTTRAARRQFDTRPPMISALSAVVVLVVYGVLWQSVRGQHPYRGPNLDVIGVVYILVAVSAVAGVAVYYRATAGVTGRSRREDGILAVPMLVGLASVYTFLGALAHDGFSNAAVYGVVDAAAPWLVAGSVLGGIAAAQRDRWKMAGGAALVMTGTAAAFFGPINVWGVLAVAGFALLVAQGVLRLTTVPQQ
jgi:hypothetical protein